jgi:methylmalonyl-CoA carboxyltransferase 12S subunit
MAMIIEVLDSGFGVLALLAMMLACCGVTYWLSRRNIEIELEKVHHQLSEIGKFKLAAEALAQNKEKLPAAPTVASAPEIAPPKVAAPPVPDELPHEMLVVIAAAVAAFLGKTVRLRSARLIQPMTDSPWAQQGRVYVQASHNLSVPHGGH